MNINELDLKIKEKKLELADLYAKKKQLVNASRIKRIPADEKRRQIAQLARQGQTADQIAAVFKVSVQTITHHLAGWMRDEAQEGLLRKKKATVIRPNQWGGETWNYDYSDLDIEIHAINDSLPHPIPHRRICVLRNCPISKKRLDTDVRTTP